MSCWLSDPDLFLYAKGIGTDDVHLWRCKKPVSSSSSSSLVMPMKPDDFDYVSNVENHMELIGYMFEWDETDYKRLVKYIFERRLLVNSQGFVIAELYKVDKDGNKMMNDAKEEVPAIYIRSLDVLALKSYIPKLRELPFPLRTVKVLEDVDGRAAVMEDSDVSKLTARVANLEAEITRLESKNNTLDTNVTKLTADMVTQMNALATLQRDLIHLKENPDCKEIWMNDLKNSEWVGISELPCIDMAENLGSIIGPQGTYTTDVDTNVRAIYWHNVITPYTNAPSGFRVVSVEDLAPNEEKARFSTTWYARRSKGKLYVMRHY